MNDDRILFGQGVASVEDLFQGHSAASIVYQDRPVAVFQRVLRSGTCMTSNVYSSGSGYCSSYFSRLTDANIVGDPADVEVGDLLLAHLGRQRRLRDFVVVPKGRIGVDVRMRSFVHEDAVVHHLIERQNNTVVQRLYL